MRTPTITTRRALALYAILLSGSLPVVLAQDKTADGYQMTWAHTLQEQTDHVVVHKNPIPGSSFLVYECSAGEALRYWKDHMETLGGRTSGNDPVRVTGVIMPDPGANAPLIFATAQKEKDGAANDGRISLAFALNDSTAAPEAPGRAAIVHDMAIQVNRAVVQAQIVTAEKRHKRIIAELEDAQHEQAVVAREKGEAGTELERANDRQADLARERTDLQDRLARLQEDQRKTPDPKTLEKMEGTRKDLARVEQDLLKQQHAEATAQADLDKQREQVPQAQEDQQERQAELDRAAQELEALKLKLQAIR